MDEILRFEGAVERDSAIDAWLKQQAAELGSIGRMCFAHFGECVDEVRDLMHDGCPFVCFGDVPFGYVNVFRAHVNVGFFRGAELADPMGLLEGTGKYMRHVKLLPDGDIDAAALVRLIESAYADMKRRLEAE